MITENTGKAPGRSRLLLMAPNPAVLAGLPSLWSPVSSETTNGNRNTRSTPVLAVVDNKRKSQRGGVRAAKAVLVVLCATAVLHTSRVLRGRKKEEKTGIVNPGCNATA